MDVWSDGIVSRANLVHAHDYVYRLHTQWVMCDHSLQHISRFFGALGSLLRVHISVYVRLACDPLAGGARRERGGV